MRILHLYQDNFSEIDSVIRQRITDGDWVLHEQPKAYTWDPDAAEYFKKFDLEVVEKITSYTSERALLGKTTVGFAIVLRGPGANAF